MDVAEFDLRVVSEQGQHAPAGVASHLGEPVVAERRDRADQQHVADIEHAGQPADRDPQSTRGVEDDGKIEGL